LHHYAYVETGGPYTAQAAAIYAQLRAGLVGNMFKEWERTGYVWEQYAPADGLGHKAHPFTGWSALVLLIMSEMY